MPIRTPPPPPVSLLTHVVERDVQSTDSRDDTLTDAGVALGLVAYAAPTIGNSGAATAESAIASGDVLETGDQGAAVRDVQRRLNRLGYPLSADGGFGPYTTSRVRDFQRDHNVAPTGKIGPTTLMSLRMAEAQRSDIAIEDLFPSVGPGRHLRLGANGIEVETLQKMLNITGSSLRVDGNFGQATKVAVQDFQRSAYLEASGELGPSTLAKLDAKVDSIRIRSTRVLDLPSGYESLEKLSAELASRDSRFSNQTAVGRAALSIALAIGGTEVFGQHTSATDFFTRLGGTNMRMKGFAQFNLDYHATSTQTPDAYTRHLADILTGLERMPNAAPASHHARALSEAVAAGRINSGADLKNFLWDRGFGGSNWQGIDDGWGRNPGLADALVNFLRSARSGASHSA